MKKKIYFKVYQDELSMGVDYKYYVDTIENIMLSIPEWIKNCNECGDLMPVLEPIEMTEDGFEKLPEFTGY